MFWKKSLMARVCEIMYIGREIIHFVDRYLPTIALSALFFLSLHIFSSWWIKWVNALWVTPVMSKLAGSELWITLILGVASVFYYVRVFIKVKRYRCSRFWIAVFYAALYLISYLCGEWNYSLIQIGNFHFAWAHLTLAPCILEMGLLLKCYFKNRHKDGMKNSLEFETTRLTSDNDSYKRLPVYKTILNTLQGNFCDEHSVAMGITSGWGTGKTTLLKYLKDELESKQKSMTVIDFYPWRYETSEKLLKTFFTLLEKELKRHILDLSSLFDEYVAELIDSKAGNYIKLLNHLRGQGSVYDRISGKLHASQHETIVFIDDLDRLEADEIMTVFKLIRNTADFPYIQFVAAYDKSYVITALKNKGIENPDKYLEKIFNVEIVLPKFEDRIICHEVESRIQKIVDDVWEKEQDKAERVKEMVYYFSLQNGSYHEYLIPTVLNTMRDVIRFRNAFYISAKMYKDSGTQYEIDFQDLFYLELIRYRYLGIYNTLRNSPLKLLELNHLILSKKEKISTEIINNDNPDDITETLIHKMFSNQNHSSKTIRNIRSYNKYFLYRLDSRILTESELLELQILDEESLLNKAENLYTDKEPHEFEHQLLEMLNNSLSEISEYEIPCRLIHLLSKTKNDSLREEISNVCVSHLNDFPSMKPDFLGKFLDLFNCIDFSHNRNTRFNTDEFLMTLLFKPNIRSKVTIHDEELQILQKTVTSFLTKTAWPEILTPGIFSILDDENLQEKSLLLPSADLRDIQLHYFLTYEDKLSESGRTLFYNCIKTTDPITKKITLYDEALSAMRTYIENHPEDYFASFLRTNQSSNPEYMTIYPEPFCNAIFKDWKNFESFLDKNHDKPGWEKVNNFWQLYKYNEYNYLTFSHQGNVYAKINNNFKDEIEQLHTLETIEEEIKSGNYNAEKIKQRLDEIPLNIIFKNRLYISIDS